MRTIEGGDNAVVERHVALFLRIAIVCVCRRFCGLTVLLWSDCAFVA